MYYALLGIDFDGYNSGSAQPSLNRNFIAGVPVNLPPIDEQRRIVCVLGALDDKIESNRRLAALLEEAATTLFGGADLGPAKVGDIAEFHNRRRVPLSAAQRAERAGDYPYYGATGIIDHLDSWLFSGTHVLVGEDGSVQDADGRPVVQYVWGQFWVNNHAHVLTFGEATPEVGYLALQRSSVSAHVTGAVQPKLSMGRLREVELRWPHDAAGLGATLAPLFGNLRSLRDEAATLTMIRDGASAQDISGGIRVPDTADPAGVIEPLIEELVV